MAVDAKILKNYAILPIPKFNPKYGHEFSRWIKCYETIMGTKNEEILKLCLLYYLSEELINDDLLYIFPNASYSRLKNHLR